MRRGALASILLALCAVVALPALALSQLASMGLLAGGAVAGGLPHRVPIGLARASAKALVARVPLGFIEIMLAQDDLAAGRLDDAESHVDLVPAGRERDALRAAVLERRSEPDAAMIAYLAAGDVAAISRVIEQESHNGDLLRARRLQRILIFRLGQDATHQDALADAWYTLGRLDAKAGYLYPKERRADWGSALGDYEQAIKLAPLTSKYLLNAGHQALTLGRLDVARGYFQGAIGVDPANASAFAGLGEAVLRAGDRAGARVLYERAFRLDPAADGVQSLGRALAA